MTLKSKAVFLIAGVLIGVSLSYPQNNVERQSAVEVLSEANSSPSGSLGVVGYKLERVKSPITISGDGKPTQLPHWFYLRIRTDEVLPQGQYIIWINDQPHRSSRIALKEFGMEIIDETLVDDATLGFSRIGDSDVGQRSILSMNLDVPEPYRKSPEEIEAEIQARTPTIRLERHQATQRVILFIEYARVKCRDGAIPTIIVIDGKERYESGCRGDAFSVSLSIAEFNHIPQGAEIGLLRYFGKDAMPRTVGNLDKTAVVDVNR